MLSPQSSIIDPPLDDDSQQAIVKVVKESTHICIHYQLVFSLRRFFTGLSALDAKYGPDESRKKSRRNPVYKQR